MIDNKKGGNKDTITLDTYECVRCSHTWHPRKEERPRICPNCISAYWDVPKKVLD